MSGPLATTVTALALLLAGWAFLAAALGRAPDRLQQLGTIALVLMTAVLLIVAVVHWAPQQPVTFVGYAVTTLLLPIGAWFLARMEPTRYGSLIVGVGALIVPVLIARLGQVWGVS